MVQQILTFDVGLYTQDHVQKLFSAATSNFEVPLNSDGGLAIEPNLKVSSTALIVYKLLDKLLYKQICFDRVGTCTKVLSLVLQNAEKQIVKLLPRLCLSHYLMAFRQDALAI